MSVRNPARSRPLSRNVKRLMKMARESPLNPEVEKIARPFTERDLAYCEMQGSIFMAAVDRNLPMSEFAPVFMNSQLAGVIDYSFSRAGGMEEDDVSNYLRMPMLLKSPSVIASLSRDAISARGSGVRRRCAVKTSLAYTGVCSRLQGRRASMARKSQTSIVLCRQRRQSTLRR